MKKTLILFFVALLSSCTTLNIKGLDIKPKGELFAYLRITEGAFIGTVERATGYYFYKENIEGLVWPILNVYEFKDGVIVDSRSTGALSSTVFEDIESIGFKPFDYEKEVELAEEKFQQADVQTMLVTFDGYEWEIMINTDQGKFLMKKWNPCDDFRNYAIFSENIEKLERIISRLLMYYGETVINIL